MSTARMSSSVRRGLTLIEVLIVIAILLAIGGLVAINLIPQKEQADIDLTRADIDRLEGAIKLFHLNMGRYPTEDEGIAVLWNQDLIEEEDELDKWQGPYLETPFPNDRWGTAWVYYYPSEEMPSLYEIISTGPDREEDTEDDVSSLDDFRDEEGDLMEDFDDFGAGELDG